MVLMCPLYWAFCLLESLLNLLHPLIEHLKTQFCFINVNNNIFWWEKNPSVTLKWQQFWLLLWVMCVIVLKRKQTSNGCVNKFIWEGGLNNTEFNIPKIHFSKLVSVILTTTIRSGLSTTCVHTSIKWTIQLQIPLSLLRRKLLLPGRSVNESQPKAERHHDAQSGQIYSPQVSDWWSPLLTMTSFWLCIWDYRFISFAVGQCSALHHISFTLFWMCLLFPYHLLTTDGAYSSVTEVCRWFNFRVKVCVKFHLCKRCVFVCAIPQPNPLSPVCWGVCWQLWEGICPSWQGSSWPGTSWQRSERPRYPAHSHTRPARLPGWSCTQGIMPSTDRDICRKEN